ncbi:MAG: right-handed parallel beta-helix repeat-containing protein [Phycisphaerae bacterium]|nr:right-handed parallel beta-helix repeat-containing protein [Phycisphaerae bacterium]
MKHAFVVFLFILSCTAMAAERLDPAAESVAVDLYPSGDRLIQSPGNTTYYVDPVKGEDGHDGKGRDSAWKSLTKVNGLSLAPGDRIEIAQGTHNGSLIPSGAGTADQPIVIVFAPGVHELPADSAVHRKLFVSNANDNPELPRPIGILCHNAKHMRITGDAHAKILFAGRMVQFVNDHCEDITYSNLTFDLKRPTVSEFRVMAVEPNSVVVRIAEGSAYAIDQGVFSWTGDIGPGWTMVQQANLETRHAWRMGRWDPFSTARAEGLGSRTVRLTYDKGHMDMIQGRQFQFRNVTRDTVSACNNRCKDIAIRDCTFHALTGMGIVSQFTEGITYQHVQVVPPPGTFRTCPAWADVFHFSGCRGDIRVEACRFSGTQDDPINVHGTHLRILARTADNQLLLRFMQPQTYGMAAFQPGDEIAVIDHASLRERPGTRRTVTSIERQTDKEWLLTLSGSAPEFEKDDVVDNVTWYPNVTIRDCTTEMTSCRGFLITTRGKVVVEDNTFIRTHMAAILVEDDAEGWFESGPIRDMTIRGNRFIACGQNGSPAVWINPHNSTAEPDKPVHENIRIENNVFDQCGISARSVKGLTIVNSKSPDGKVPITLKACTDVTCENNDGMSQNSTGP